jgi:hypothetical protein
MPTKVRGRPDICKRPRIGTLCRTRYSHVRMFLWQHRCTISYAMATPSKPFIVARRKCVAPKPRRIERLPSGYAVQEFRDDSQGCYWYVVTALELMRNDKRCRNRVG